MNLKTFTVGLLSIIIVGDITLSPLLTFSLRVTKLPRVTATAFKSCHGKLNKMEIF